MATLLDKKYEGFESLSDVQRDVVECFDGAINPQAGRVPPSFKGKIRVRVEFFPAREELPEPEIHREGSLITIRYPLWDRHQAWYHLMRNPPEGVEPFRLGMGLNQWKKIHEPHCAVWVYDTANPKFEPEGWRRRSGYWPPPPKRKRPKRQE